MTFCLRTAPAIILLSCFIVACNNTTEEKNAAASTADTSFKPPILVTLKTTLKETLLNEKTVIANKRLAAAPAMNTETCKTLSVKVIDSTATSESHFNYKILDTLFAGPTVKILLIGREYESENIIWMAVYDLQNKLLDHRTVYYDNAEGFMSVETIIKNDQLNITTYNEYAEQENEKKRTEVFHLNEDNKIVKE